jgi:gas vesicle structural protein
MMTDEEFESEQLELSLLETLDHVLTRGLVIAGEITISVADIDLIFVGLNVILTSIETAQEVLGARKLNAQPNALAPAPQASAPTASDAEGEAH